MGGSFSNAVLSISVSMVACDVCGSFRARALISLRSLFFVTAACIDLCSLFRGSWVVILDDCNIVIGQEDVTFFDPVAQEEVSSEPTFPSGRDSDVCPSWARIH